VSNVPSKPVSFSRPKVGYFSNRPRILSTYLITLSLYLTVWFVPVAVDTVKNCTPDDGCVKHPKHVG